MGRGVSLRGGPLICSAPPAYSSNVSQHEQACVGIPAPARMPDTRECLLHVQGGLGLGDETCPMIIPRLKLCLGRLMLAGVRHLVAHQHHEITLNPEVVLGTAQRVAIETGGAI